jgi:rRNA maturation protein Nop10
MKAISTAIHRWCDQCGRFTLSVICSNGHNPVEVCADHPCDECGE